MQCCIQLQQSLNALLLNKMTGETQELRSDKRKPKMPSRLRSVHRNYIYTDISNWYLGFTISLCRSLNVSHGLTLYFVFWKALKAFHNECTVQYEQLRNSNQISKLWIAFQSYHFLIKWFSNLFLVADTTSFLGILSDKKNLRTRMLNLSLNYQRKFFFTIRYTTPDVWPDKNHIITFH